VFSDLERLLDQVTPLYKARIEDLAPQPRVVLDALALHWDPATAAQLAETTGLATPAVSAQLDRLLKMGLLEKAPVSTSRRTAFQLGERFFNIWYLMRHGPRRQRTRLRWLTGFLRGFYTPAQLHERGKALLQQADGGAGHHDYALALSDAVNEPGLRYLLGAEARQRMEAFALAHGQRLEDLTDPDDLPQPQTAAEWYGMGWWLQTELGRFEDAEQAYRRAIEIDPEFASPWNNLGNLLTNHLNRPDEGEQAYRRAIEIDPSDTFASGNLAYLLATQEDRQAELDTLLPALLPRLRVHAAALLAAYRALAQDNFGTAAEHLGEALDSEDPGLLSAHQDDVLRVLRLAAARGYGERLLAWMDARGLGDRYWPLRAAFDAYLHGEERLLDVNPEVRVAARQLFEWLDRIAKSPSKRGHK